MELSAQHLKKNYQLGTQHVQVLRDVSLQLKSGDVVGIVGASGSGKSTLLHLLGGIDEADSGELLIDGKHWSALSEHEKAKWRNQYFGFVFQFFHLLPELSALENVMLPAILGGASQQHAAEQAMQLLHEVGLQDRAKHRPHQLSGGEKQRVAIGRALINRPQLLLADEPTGNLDAETGEKVWRLLRNLSQQHGAALVVVSHNRELIAELPQVWELKNGMLCSFVA